MNNVRYANDIVLVAYSAEKLPCKNYNDQLQIFHVFFFFRYFIDVFYGGIR